MEAIILHLADLDSTKKLGMAIARAARAGDVIGLVGSLGAGKTTLTQAIGAGLGLPPNAVASPTFTLLAEHRGGRIPLYHLDVYRLTGPSDLEQLAFDDYLLAGDGLIVLEWADLVPDALPEDRLTVRFTSRTDAPQTRQAVLELGGPESLRLQNAVLDAWQASS